MSESPRRPRSRSSSLSPERASNLRWDTTIDEESSSTSGEGETHLSSFSSASSSLVSSFSRKKRSSSSSGLWRSSSSSRSTTPSWRLSRSKKKRRKHSTAPPPLELSSDADTELMCHRKRSLSLGHFTLLGRNRGGIALEDTPSFMNVVKSYDGFIRYVKVPPDHKESNYPKTRYSKVRFDGKIPGVGKRFNVAWSLPDGRVRIDYAVKLYDFGAVHELEINCDHRSPKSPWFGLIDPRILPAHDEKINFDANVFWTVGFLYKHFGTCGIELWDKEIKEIALSFSDASSVPSKYMEGIPSFCLPFASAYRPNSEPCDTHSIVDPSTSSSNKNENLVLLTGHACSSSDNQSEDYCTRYTGCVTEWRLGYGFLSSTLINGRIFLHWSDIVWSSGSNQLKELPIGTSVNFQLSLDSQKRYKAVSARLFQ